MLRLELLLEAVDRLTGPIRAVQARMAALREVAERLGRVRGAAQLGLALRQVGVAALASTRQVIGLTARMAALGAAAAGAFGFFFSRQFIRPAADLEQLALRIQAAMGSAAGGEQAMAFIRDFARANGQSLTEVAAAFLELRTQGITPTAREMAALGNAAAATGAGHEAAANALTSALAGQFSQLRAFGIQARTEGEQVFLEWEAQGRRMRAVIERGNRAGLAAAVTQAFTDRFPQGMERAGETWDGLLSRMGETWREFSRMVMEAGVFDYLRDRLRQILAAVDRLTADGTLQRWATETAAAIMAAFGAVERFVTAGEGQAESPFMAMLGRIRELTQPLADIAEYFGGVETALFGIGLVLAGPVLMNLAALSAAIAVLGGVLLTTPAGWFALAAGGLTALALAIRNDWGGLGGFLSEQIEALITLFRRLEEAVGAPLRRMGLLRDVMEPWTGPSGPRIGPAPPGPIRDGRPPAASGLDPTPPFMHNLVPPGGLGPAPPPAAAAPAVRLDAGGTLHLHLHDHRAPRVEGRMNDPRIRLSPDRGLTMGVR